MTCVIRILPALIAIDDIYQCYYAIDSAATGMLGLEVAYPRAIFAAGSHACSEENQKNDNLEDSKHAVEPEAYPTHEVEE